MVRIGGEQDKWFCHPVLRLGGMWLFDLLFDKLYSSMSTFSFSIYMSWWIIGWWDNFIWVMHIWDIILSNSKGIITVVVRTPIHYFIWDLCQNPMYPIWLVILLVVSLWKKTLKMSFEHPTLLTLCFDFDLSSVTLSC